MAGWIHWYLAGCIYIYLCRFFKLAGWVHWCLTGCIYMYVYGFLKLASLSKLIFGKFFLKKKKNEKLAGSIYMCVCIWIIKIGRLNTLIFDRMHLKICMWILHQYLTGLMEYICMWIFKVDKFEYVDIWQVLYQKKKNWQLLK